MHVAARRPASGPELCNLNLNCHNDRHGPGYLSLNPSHDPFPSPLRACANHASCSAIDSDDETWNPKQGLTL